LRDRNYPLPGTWVFANQEAAVRIPDAIRFPVIAKPSHPLGQFKANRVDDKQGLVALVAAHPGTPMVIQEWIPGSDEDIFFCATVAKNGKPLCFFDGVKYLSHPPARGQTVVAGPSDLRDLRKLLIRFVADANLDGPVSIEAKRDPRGKMRIIEPTVGRTDFWAKLAITNGIDLPYYEYLSVTSPQLDIVEHRPRIQKIWFDSEKDPASFIRLFGRICRKKRKFWLPSFCYLDLKDWQPFWKSMAQLLGRTRRYLERRLGISRVTNTSNK
jgi:D-aspartate ligase